LRLDRVGRFVSALKTLGNQRMIRAQRPVRTGSSCP
jgi:hypothetical protein